MRSAFPRQTVDDVPRSTGTDIARPGSSPAAHLVPMSDRWIVIVDDEPIMIAIIERHLERAGYRNVQSTDDAVHGMALIGREAPDVVLLDVHMPKINGLEILGEMQRDERMGNTSAIVLTASMDEKVKVRALELGACDLLYKPVNGRELLARLENTLQARAYQDHLREYSAMLEATVAQRTAELELYRREMVDCLVRAAGFRDDDTGHHMARVGRYARVIGSELELDPMALDLLEQAARLHDIGKLGVPDAILFKPGMLTPDEFEVMRIHCNFGKRIIGRMSDEEIRLLGRHTEFGGRLLEGCRSPILELALTIALTHHERWDGSGYPLGLAGEDIPLEGRITAVADVFDALSSRRPYKPPFHLDRCLSIMEAERATRFDPRALDAMIARREDILETQLAFADGK